MIKYVELKKVIELVKDYGKRAIDDGRKTLDPVDDIVAIIKAIEDMPAVEN